MEEMKKVQQQLVQDNLPSSSQQIIEQQNIMHERVELHEKNQHIRELEGRCRTLNQDNELLRSQVDESDYWIYERGPIQQELLELRDNSVSQTREINRLTRENANISEDLRTAESMLKVRARRHEPHEIGHPPMNAEERARANAAQFPARSSITQTLVNNMFRKSQKASRQSIVNNQKDSQN